MAKIRGIWVDRIAADMVGLRVGIHVARKPLWCALGSTNSIQRCVVSSKAKAVANRILEGLPELYDYQHSAVRLAMMFYNESEGKGGHHLIASPTGTGKSYMILRILGLNYSHGYVVTPKIEIVVDMLAKIGVDVSQITMGNIEAYMLEYRILTPIRFRNLILAGRIDVELIKWVLFDEAHHDEADTYALIRACLPDSVVFIGTTATPFRGTPKETATFRERWGKIHWAITEKEAYERGFLALPDCETWPLVDDDLVEIGKNGEFIVSRVTAATKDKLVDLFTRCKERELFTDAGKPTRPMVIGIHSSEIIEYMKLVAVKEGIQLAFITQETDFKTRQKLFAGCLACEFALVHINTISEGVDLSNKTARLRVYIDLACTNSPIMFVQRFGRARRPLFPNETEPPLYICTNRNLERHGYILDGVLPAETITKAQLAFERPSERSKSRVFGIETLGKLRPTNVQLNSGLSVQIFAISCMEGNKKNEFLVLLHPCHANPVWFRKESPLKEDGTRDYGKWSIEWEPPSELKGFRSNPPGPLTEGQMNMWNQHATKMGLLVTQVIDQKKFQLLPALRNIGVPLT